MTMDRRPKHTNRLVEGYMVMMLVPTLEPKER